VCGITGWVDWERDLRRATATLARMTATMACRGPDGQGAWSSQRAAFGHRRLAVIDVAGGAQPLSAPLAQGAQAVLAYNGEIFNFVELRRQLCSHGHSFLTRCDTEVLVHAYAQWGSSCVDRLNGMFAFAIWDEHAEELLLARDHLGIKPLYYYPYRGGLLFGSEPKALLANALFRPELDGAGLAELFAMFGSHTPGQGVFRGLREVRPGCVVRFSRRGLAEQRYWELVSRRHEDDVPTTIRTVRELLADTVERQLVSDVPLCVLVSGGVDSSAIAALASDCLARRRSGRLSTYSVDFKGSESDFVADELRPSRDGPYIRLFQQHVPSRHTDIVLDTPDLLNAQGLATRARDLPGLGDLDGSLFLLFKAIREHSTVALSGESADEVFGGYAWFHDREAVDRDGFPWAVGGQGLARALEPGVQARIRAEEYVADRYREALAEAPLLDGENRHDRPMREVSYLALTRFLPVLLDRKDRMSMAVGLEVRVPFCDHRLLEYVWNVPWRLKSLGGVPKALLREAVADLLPREVAYRPKSVFPAATSAAYDHNLQTGVQAMLSDGSPLTPLLDSERVAALAAGVVPLPVWRRRMALAYLLQVDTWLRTYNVRVTVAA